MTAYGADGVYVVTPHNAHYLYVKEAIEAGLRVLDVIEREERLC